MTEPQEATFDCGRVVRNTSSAYADHPHASGKQRCKAAFGSALCCFAVLTEQRSHTLVVTDRAPIEVWEIALEFTGEYFIPGASHERIAADHYARYEFAKRFVANKSVLDIACGTGYAGPMMISAGAKAYLGVDIQDKLVDHAKQNYGSKEIAYRVGDVTTFEIDAPADVIISFETIEHVRDYTKALACLKAAMKPGGTLLISSPNRPVTTPLGKDLTTTPENRHHTQEFTVAELTRLVRETGLEVSENDVFGQRMRPAYLAGPGLVNRVARRFSRRNYDNEASATLERIEKKAPRYFLLVATLPASTGRHSSTKR